MHSPHTLRTPYPRRAVLRLLGLPAMGALAAAPLASAWAQSPAAKPPRIVSVSGSLTEIVYALGAEQQLVGTDTTSLYPAAAQRTSKVGYMRQLSAEGLLSLRPDAVIGTTDAGPSVVMAQIRSAGVQVELVNTTHDWAELGRKVAAVGRATAQVEAARALQAQLEAQWAQTQKVVGQYRGRVPKVLFVLSHGPSPQVAGAQTAAHAMLGFAGLRNAMAEPGGPSVLNGYRPMTSEALVNAAPDVIVTTTQGIEAIGGVDKFWARPGLTLTPAYQRRALVAMDALLLIGFGPRLPQAVLELHQATLKAAA